MKFILQLLFISIVGISSMSVYAEGMTLGMGYHLGTYDGGSGFKANPNAIKLEATKYLADNVAIEGHLLFGSGSDTISGTDADLKLKNAMSVFIKGDLPLSDSANLYGLLGFSQGKLEMSVPGGTMSDDDSGLSYGFGVEVAIANDLYISGEYILYISESDYDYTGFNIGLAKKF